MKLSNFYPLLFCVFACVSCLNPDQKAIKNTKNKNGLFAKIITEKGTVIARLEFEKVPLTVANFVGLAQGLIPNTFKNPGMPFYDSLRFYKVFKGNKLLSGCPKNNGIGHPGYLFADEFHKDLLHDDAGVLSMISNGEHSNGSQFVITQRSLPALDNKNPVFGKVISGMEIVNTIQQGDRIMKIEIIKIGRKAKKFNPLAVFSANGFEHMIKL